MFAFHNFPKILNFSSTGIGPIVATKTSQAFYFTESAYFFSRRVKIL